jgi:ATP-binding cassette subfamily B protein
VTVTHRLASVVAADWIVVFHNGRIAETGTHHELLQLAGVYKEMWDKQNGFSLTSDGFSARINGERLSQLPFFRGIPLEQIEAISELFVTEQYDEGHYLIRENELGDKFYIIVRGSVNVVKCGARVAVLEDGDHFGEIALLHNIPRTADIVTRMPTVLLSLRGATLLELTKDYPTIRHVLEQSLKERLK